jgi:hypothetical protein
MGWRADDASARQHCEYPVIILTWYPCQINSSSPQPPPVPTTTQLSGNYYF